MSCCYKIFWHSCQVVLDIESFSFNSSFLGYIIGIIWFLALAHPSVNNRTYFSENALLPGMVDTRYEYGRTAKSLKSEVENPSEMYRYTVLVCGCIASL